MHITTVDANDIPVRVCLGFLCVVSGGRGKNPGNLRLSRRCSRPRVPCDRKLGMGHRIQLLDQTFAAGVLATYLVPLHSSEIPSFFAL